MKVTSAYANKLIRGDTMEQDQETFLMFSAHLV